MAKTPFKVENKNTAITLPANMAVTEPADSTNHKYRIYMEVFWQPDVLKT
jgi:hypothetical protein